MEKVLKIFCLPYAGGSASIYSEWVSFYGENVEIIPIEYKGHGSRFCEPFYNCINEAAFDVAKKISEQKPKNYAIFGHSMGCLIAVESAMLLQQTFNCPPKAVIVGGTRPLHLYDKEEKILHLPKDEFMNKFFEMGQMTDEVVQKPELMDLLYDVFYADVKMIEEYKAPEVHEKLRMPLYISAGLSDGATPLDEMQDWREYAGNDFYLDFFEAGHFFPFCTEEFHEYFLKTVNEINKRS